ncbi:hypothetical protein [Ruminococcus sp. HUN007]|uniref:CdaR family protein n=1 Tax=Ruminococcus sp. HUN007 TaxID=1514668 RepID=UPI0005D171F9|nr:hypothetical protein [Ruminococcus sp. HUN007]
MKNIINKVKLFVERSLERDSVLLVISVLLAVFIWGYITTQRWPDDHIYINDVPVDFEASIAGTPAEAEGYKIYDADVQNADIRVDANRKYIGFLTKKEFYIKVSADNYSGEQPVTAKLTVQKTDDNSYDCDYKLKEPSQNKAKVYFYKEITKTVDVTVKAPGITAAEGHKLKSLTCESVSVTGPEPYVNMISSCELNITQNVAYDTRRSFQVTASLGNLTFLNENGEDINKIIRPYMSKNQFTINKSELTVMVNISSVKNIDIQFSHIITDVPDYFNKQFILDRLSLSTPTITVSSDDTSIDDIDSLPVSSDESISLSSINTDFSASFDLTRALESYPKLKNDSNVVSTYLKFESSGLAEKTFDSVDDSRFTIKNPYSSKYTAELVTQRLDNVTIIGPEEDIEKITADNLTVEIDLSKSTVSGTGKLNTGISTYKALVLLPSKYKNVWAYGEYTVDVEIYENEFQQTDVTTASSD